jgi:hypothetical protein
MTAILLGPFYLAAARSVRSTAQPNALNNTLTSAVLRFGFMIVPALDKNVVTRNQHLSAPLLGIEIANEVHKSDTRLDPVIYRDAHLLPLRGDF